MQLDQALEDKAAEWRKERARKASLSRKSKSNQYITASKERLKLAAGDAIGPDRDRVRAEYAAAKLEAHIAGTLKMSPSQVQAAKVVIDKGKPSLSAIEATVVDAAATRSEADIIGDLRALFAAHPGLVQQILCEQAKDVSPGQPNESNAALLSAQTSVSDTGTSA